MNNKLATASNDGAVKPSLPGKNLKQWLRLWPLVPLVAVLIFFIQMLLDVEYSGHDVLENGLGIFRCLAPHKAEAAQANSVVSDVPLFMNGMDSIRPDYVRQGQIYDCNFLAPLISFSANERGRVAILNMVRQLPDGTYLVTFPGAKNEPVHTGALTRREQSLYACAKLPDGTLAGLWLPVIEKAYGQYRNSHLNVADRTFKAVKHGIFDGRWTADAELPGFAASYGAADDEACRLLTGNGVKRMETASFEIGDYGLGKSYVTSRQIMSWFRRRQVLRNFEEEQNASLVSAPSDQPIAIATTELQALASEHGLRPGHAYAVLAYNPVSKQITLKDPFAEGELINPATGRALDGKNDGIFSVSLQQFNHFFSRLRVEEQPPRHSAS